MRGCHRAHVTQCGACAFVLTFNNVKLQAVEMFAIVGNRGPCQTSRGALDLQSHRSSSLESEQCHSVPDKTNGNEHEIFDARKGQNCLIKKLLFSAINLLSQFMLQPDVDVAQNVYLLEALIDVNVRDGPDRGDLRDDRRRRIEHPAQTFSLQLFTSCRRMRIAWAGYALSRSSR